MFIKTIYKEERGLTFLEIVVVIALITIGALIVSSGFDEVRKRARDSTRVSDISQIQRALGLYNISANRFPIEPDEVAITGNDKFSQVMQNEFEARRVPTDPLTPVLTYRYISNEDGSDYHLGFCLETESIAGYTRGCENEVGP